ncbi:hypothetical protein [Streptomyces exfoliatus]|uniref:hypothetical protein n=1 Tax=Streptomyces exfoliatus TaxID=1905 RepID=UPI003C2EFDE0
MTTTPRPRFSVRAGLAAASEHDGPFDDVPEHLLVPLQAWVDSALDSMAPTSHGWDSAGAEEDDLASRRLCLRLRIPLVGPRLGETTYRTTLNTSTGHQLLDIIDALLAGRGVDQVLIRRLAELLEDGGSAYRVADTGTSLEERVTPAVRDAVHQAVADAAASLTAGSASGHLAAAWRSAYGRSPDAVRAYSESIKAVEAAAHAVIQPNHAKATLGTMLGEIKGARHKFTFAIPTATGDPIAPAEALMRALWDGQTSRHGSQGGTVPETLEAARAGVHLAATLVQWFVSGAVVRTP